MIAKSALRHCQLVVVVVLSLVLLACISLFAQVNTGRILGTVTDQTGGVIAGSMVTVTNSDTGVARNLTADAAGEYNAPNLIPGTYVVRGTAMGFQNLERRGIVVQVGADVRIDLQLSPGQVTQTIQVTEAAPLLDTTSATITGTVNTVNLSDLPLNGRNYQRLLVLAPGQVQQPGGGTNTQVSNGLRPGDTSYLVDGLDNNEPFQGQSIVNSSSESGDAGTILPVDAIQEFNVETNPPAEFGRKAGTVVNVGLKSGTNNIHGSAYAFGRDSAMDARNFFNPPPQPVAPLNFEQWGATAGGPIKKDKLFYFGAYERETYTIGNPFTASLPTTARGLSNGTAVSILDAEAALTAKCGSVAALAPDCGTGVFVPNALSASLLPQYGPNTTNSNLVPLSFPDVIGTYSVLGKVDYHPSDHHAISGSYFLSNGNLDTQDQPQITQSYWRSNAGIQAEFVIGDWTWTPNSNWVNVLRFGWDRYNNFIYQGDRSTPALSYGMNTGVTNPVLDGLPNISVAGFTTLGGGSNWPALHGPSNTYDIVDQVSYLRGKHAFKFGGEALYYNADDAKYNKGRGDFFFATNDLFSGSTPLEAFLAGVPDHALLLEGNDSINVSEGDYSGFAEDVWRLTSQVTLNLGLRYEYFTPIGESNNKLGTWEPTTGFEQLGVNTNTIYHGDHKDLAPRLGVAWDVGGKGKNVVRAGYGIFYTQIPYGAFFSQNFNNAATTGFQAVPTGYTAVLPNGTTQPVLQGGTIATTGVTFPGSALDWVPAPGGPIFPAVASSAFECGNGIGGNPSPCSMMVANPNLVNPLISLWNLSVQHSFAPNLSLEVAYVGSHSKRLPGFIDINEAAPGTESMIGCPLTGAALTPSNCLQVARPYYSQYPYVGFINYLTNLDTSNYNALQTTLTERNLHGLSLLFSYTYSHALDDMSQYSTGAYSPEDSFAPYLDYGNSDFDIRHHVSISVTYNIPGKKSPAQLLEGWSVNSLVALQSGLPWNAVDASDDISQTAEFTDRWDFLGNPKDFTAGLNPIPFYPGSLAGTSGMPAACTNAAAANGATASLAQFGCYAQGSSVMIAPALGSFGTLGRNVFRDSGFRDWDLSVFKNWKFKERLTAQFRAEFFNVLNHPTFANPGLNGTNDPSGAAFGGETSSPDVAAANPVLGTGGPRELQLGLKLLF